MSIFLAKKDKKTSAQAIAYCRTDLHLGVEQGFPKL
jgi:hypothetical protein